MFVSSSNGVVILMLPWKPKQGGRLIKYYACFGGKQREKTKLQQLKYFKRERKQALLFYQHKQKENS